GSVINQATGARIPGVPIRLFTQLRTFVGETRTDANGAYAFTNEPAGSYQVVQLLPAGLTSLAAVPGINGANIPGTTRELAVTVVADVNSANNNFLDASTTLPATGTISGSVFRDVNGNGMIYALD